jgi:imidazolonepropionase-like amidohydrolase
MIVAPLLARGAPTVVLSNVTIIDGTGSPAKPDMTVIISGDRITAVVPTGSVSSPKDSLIIDASGKFLIPGLWDMHVHLSDASAADASHYILPQFVANAVTGVRDMGGDLKVIDTLRVEVHGGKTVGPRILRCGPFVDGPKEGATDRLTVRSEAEARDAVRSLKRDGVDFIKVHNGISRQPFFALADEAKKEGIPFCVHLPRSISISEATSAGAKSIEHMETFLESALRQRKLPGKTVEEAISAVDAEYTNETGAKLFSQFRKNRTWVDPTLIEYFNFAHEGEDAFLHDPRMKYVPKSLMTFWEKNFPLPTSLATTKLAVRQTVFDRLSKLVGEIHAAGVGMIAGTDLGARGVFPGSSLHDELILLVKAGLTPMDALQCATRNAAEVLGLSDSMGTIQKGKIADLVLLNANPLDDISNIKQIDTVIAKGRVHDRTDLHRMLAESETR